MTKIALSRRSVLEAGACALAGAASVHAWMGSSTSNEEIVRRYYAAWEKKDWSPFDVLLADSFTFTSANNDDHIGKSAFKARCWESQIDFIERFELERVIGNGDEAFVKYLGRTKNGKSFRNVDYFRLKNEKVEAIECYFGGQFGYPSAASTEQR
jgi:ketosteroid isomerase-like protein